ISRLGGGRAGAGTQAVDDDDIRAGAGNTAGDGGHVVDGGDLYQNRLFVVGGLLQGVDQLPQVLDGIDVVVGGGGDGVSALRDHAGFGDVSDVFGPRQVPADARLGPL